MLSGQDILFRLLSVILLIAINAFFVTAEFSIVAVRRSRISQLVAEGDIQARVVQGLQSRLDRLLSTTQLGITLSSLALGWIGEDTMAASLEQFFNSLPLPETLTRSIASGIAIPIAFLLIAYLQIVLGELCPKSLALIYAEEIARWFAPPSLAIARIFKPFIWVLNQSNRTILKLFGVSPIQQSWWHDRVTPEELQLIIATERESMGLEAEERQLLRNVFEFGDVVASEIMTPRTQIHAISYDSRLRDLLSEVSLSNHSCYPINGESLDDIRGYIRFRDFSTLLAEGNIKLDSPIQKLIKPIRFVSKETPIADLLPQMQRNRQPMVMVVDEFGGTAGLVTLKDVINEIIGDDSEDDFTARQQFQNLDDHTFLVDAQIDLEELNELLNVTLPATDDYQTLSGFLLYHWQKIPQAGEIFDFGDLCFQVVTVDGPRLQQIKITRQEIPIPAMSELNSINNLETPQEEIEQFFTSPDDYSEDADNPNPIK